MVSFTKRHKVILLLLILVCLTGFFGATNFINTYAADTKVVRVGYFETEAFLEGASDGQMKSGYGYDYLQKIASYTGWKYSYVYGTDTELISMLQNGEIDLLPGLSYRPDWAELILYPDLAMGTRTDGSNEAFYLCVSSSRLDLLEELNFAQNEIILDSPGYQNTLLDKYHTTDSVRTSLSPLEQQWVSRRNAIYIGYITDYMPFCGVVDGQVSGLVVDLSCQLLSVLGIDDQLEIRYKGYPSYDDMQAALLSDKIDVAFPVFSSPWHSEQAGIAESEPVVSTVMDVIFKGEYTANTCDTIAVSSHSPIQRIYAELLYPDSTIYECEDVEGCLRAVQDGDASCTLFTSFRTDYFLSSRSYENLHSIQLIDNNYYCFGIKSGNIALVSLMNRGISLLDQTALTSAMYSYASSVSYYTKWDFFFDNLAFIIFGLVVAVIFAIVVIDRILVLSHRNKRATKESAALKILSETDQMTGLLNRASGEKKVRKALADGATGMFILLDIDEFKHFNDTYGHGVGDQVLVAVAGCLKRTFREKDILFRLGGDEFAVFASNVDNISSGDTIVKRFFERVEQIQIEELGAPITTSVGAYVFGEEGIETFESLYKSADSCMYESKHTSGNALTFYKR